MRRIVLLSFDWHRPKDPPLSLGHASILSNLLKNKIPTIPFSPSVASSSFDLEALVKQVLEFNEASTDLCVGTFIWNEHHVQKITKSLKNANWKGKVILGGPQISYASKGLEHFYPNADYFIRGYGETALQKYASGTSSKSIQGLHKAGEPDLALQGKSNLENLPSPYLEGIVPLQKFVRWETQRGCPFRCSFCQHRESGPIEKKFIAPERIRKEIELFCKSGIVEDIAVVDPTFNSGPHYLAVLQQYIDEGYKGKISLQSRFEMCKPEYLDLCEKLNQKAHVQLEFGLQTTHSKEWSAINRPNNMKKADEMIQELKKRGLDYEVSIIYGLPNQTLSSFRETVNWCLERQVPTLKAWPLMLLRGTPLEAEKEKYGFEESEEEEGLPEGTTGFAQTERIVKSMPHVVKSNTFSRKEFQEMAKIAKYLSETEGNHPKQV